MLPPALEKMLLPNPPALPSAATACSQQLWALPGMAKTQIHHHIPVRWGTAQYPAPNPQGNTGTEMGTALQPLPGSLGSNSSLETTAKIKANPLLEILEPPTRAEGFGASSAVVPSAALSYQHPRDTKPAQLPSSWSALRHGEGISWCREATSRRRSIQKIGRV